MTKWRFCPTRNRDYVRDTGPVFYYRNGQLWKLLPYTTYTTEYVSVFKKELVAKYADYIESTDEWLGMHRLRIPVKNHYYHRVILPTAYKKRPHHKKKELSIEEENRRLWKKEKQRDKHWQGFHGPGRWFKKETSRKNRAYTRTCMHREQYEDIHTKYGKMKMGYWD